MAGPGPAPKHPSERRHRAVPARGEWIEIYAPKLEEPVLPTLREMVGVIRLTQYNQVARRKWEAWRYDPVTSYWGQSDIHFALETLDLYNDEPWTKNAAEVRHRQDRLALTPKGKRDQRFKIMFGIGVEASKDRPPPPDQSDSNVVSMDDRRQGLGHGA